MVAGNGSSMPRKPRTRRHRYHLRNWSEYNRALKARGSITLWMDESAIEHWTRRPGPEEKLRRGHPVVYSDLAIRSMLTLKAVFHLSLRATEGFASSLMEIMRLPATLRAPSFSTISRRGRKLHVDLGVRRVHHNKRTEPLHLVVDSTGLKLHGEGEWKVKRHGWVKHRKWFKMHLLVDGKTLLVRAVTTSGQYESDSKEFVKLLGEETDPVAYVKGDGAYDTHEAYDAMRARPEHPVAIFPPHRERRAGTKPRPDRGHPRVEGQRVNPGGYRHHLSQHGNSKAPQAEPLDRDRHVRRIREVGRKRWKDEVGFGERSLAETTVSRFEHIFGPSLCARSDATRETEVRIKVAALNRMTELGMPDSYLFKAA
jgi:hypothetical protein